MLFLVDVLVDWQEHFLAPWEISSSRSIYLSSTSGLQKHRVLTHPVYYRAAVPLPAGGAGDIVHTMSTLFVSVVVKDNFRLLIIPLLLKVASVFNMLISAGFMCFPAADIWELLGIHHNSNDMFAEKAICEVRLCVRVCIWCSLVPSVLGRLRLKDRPTICIFFSHKAYLTCFFISFPRPGQTLNKSSDHLAHYNT